MAANFNQTNKNQNRYFFATTEEGEQDLYVSTITAGAITDYYVGISGSGGNLVQINQMPDVIGTSTAGGEEMLYAGTASTYKTLSSINTAAAGISLSIDREGPTGIATIENYGTNGSLRGFEFLSRGVDSALISTTSLAINNYMSSIGRPAATAVLGTSGTWLTGGVQASQIQSLDYASGGGGRTCFNINDLSGAGGLQSQQRWSIGTTGTPTGGNTGSDFALYSYSDAGNFITSPLQIRRADGAMSIQNLSSINGVPFDLSGVLPWEVYTVTNTATQAVSLSPGVPQTVLTFSNIPVPAQGINAGGMAMSVNIAVQNTGLAGPAILNLAGYYGGSASAGSGVHSCCVLSPNLNNQIITLSGIAIHNGSSNVLNITAVSDTAGTFNFVQGTTAFYKFFFQPVF